MVFSITNCFRISYLFFYMIVHVMTSLKIFHDAVKMMLRKKYNIKVENCRIDTACWKAIFMVLHHIGRDVSCKVLQKFFVR